VNTLPTGELLAEDDRTPDAYARVLRIRFFEEAAHRMFLQNEVEGSLHLSDGQEAVSVGVCLALRAEDFIAATYRGHAACLARGSSPESLFAELLGRRSGTNGGRGGSMNLVDLEHGVIGCFGIVGGSIAAATGMALAAQLRAKPTIAVAFFGDGAVNQAYFHECLNFAGVRRLPVVYVCENNQYGEFTAWRSVTAGESIVSRGAAYGIPGVEVDGNDVFAVHDAAAEAAARAREDGGATLLVCETYRHKGHSRHDDPRRYRPQSEVDQWLARDPVLALAAQLEDSAEAEIRARVQQEIDEALERARAAPLPDPAVLASATKSSYA
jgi:TPP-dependent pyruvate/acetoin dehydrogenase alpha subunit